MKQLSIYRDYRYHETMRCFLTNKLLIDKLKDYKKKSNEPVPIEIVQYRNKIGFYHIDYDYKFTEQLKNVAYYNSQMNINLLYMMSNHNRSLSANTNYYRETNVYQRFLYNSFHSFRRYYMKSTIQKIKEYRNGYRKNMKRISTFKYQHLVQPSFKTVSKNQ